jgi:hypothetical protein
MGKVLVLHHSKLDISDNLLAHDSLASYTHMANMKSELNNADFISFVYLLKTRKCIFNNINLAPWVYFKIPSILIRIPYCFYLCIKYDKLIVYHSEGFYYYYPIFLLFRSKIIIQVNEIYAIISQNKAKLFFEKLYIKSFSKLIVSNVFLKNNWFPNKNVLIRGGYFRKVDLDLDILNNTHSFIYVGTIDEHKYGNLSILIKLINTIPPNVKLILCLMTTDIYYDMIHKSIKNNPNISLNRDVKDSDLKFFYNKCKYGLVIQDQGKPINTTGFPSKIFSYLNHGLIPIAERLDCFQKSEVNELFIFIQNWDWSELMLVKPSNNTFTNVSNKLVNSLIYFINQN